VPLILRLCFEVNTTMKAFPKLKKYALLFPQTKFQKITKQLLDELKTEYGVYFFQNGQTEKIDYIGTATGQSGIKGRVKNQHLYENYKKSVFRKKLSNENQTSTQKESVDFIKKYYTIGIIYMPEHPSIIKAFEQVLIFEKLPKYNSESNRT
jgi:hypothetical protein